MLRGEIDKGSVLEIVTFYKVTNLFRHTPLQITFRPINVIFCQFLRRPHLPNLITVEYVCGLRCATCRNVYIGQSVRSITTRYQEHTRYIITNTLHSPYALHLLNTQLEYGSTENTLHMLKSCHKGNLMNIWEKFYMQQLHHLQLLIDEQSPQELNPLYTLGYIPRLLATLDGS
jgi:hypothetical protein